MDKHLLKMIVLNFIILSNIGLYANNGSSYIMFIKQKERPFEESAVLYLKSITVEKNIRKDQSLYMEDQKFIVKYLRFPEGADDLISCCEVDSILFHGYEHSLRLEKQIGSSKFDSIYTHYSQITNQLIQIKHLFYKLRSQAFILKESLFDIYLFKADIEICDCVYLYSNFEERKPLGYEAYLKKIDKIFKIKKREQNKLKENINMITDHDIIKYIINVNTE